MWDRENAQFEGVESCLGARRPSGAQHLDQRGDASWSRCPPQRISQALTRPDDAHATENCALFRSTPRNRRHRRERRVRRVGLRERAVVRYSVSQCASSARSATSRSAGQGFLVEINNKRSPARTTRTRRRTARCFDVRRVGSRERAIGEISLSRCASSGRSAISRSAERGFLLEISCT